MEEKMVRNGDVSICTESFGDPNNPAILLIAGATVSMLFWDENFCKELANKGFYVIRFDNRDVGRSTFYEPGTTPYDIINLTDDAISVLNGYNIEKANLVGMSLGGLISQIAALKYPERVQTLTLMSTGPWGDSDLEIPEMDTRILDFHAKSGAVDWQNEESVVNYLMEGAALMSGRKPFNKESNEQRIRAEFRRAKNYLSMFNHAALQGGEEYYNRLDEINHPTLIIHGTDDLIWHFKHSGVLLDQIQHSDIIELEGTGHEIHAEDWDTIIDGITWHINES